MAWLDRIVAGEGVIKCLTVRHLVLSKFCDNEWMNPQIRRGTVATDETRKEHGYGGGQRWGSAGASPYRVLRTVTIRIESGLREGERPRETLTWPGSLPRPKDGDSQGTLALPLESSPCLIRGCEPVRLRNAECGLGKTEPRDCPSRSMRTTGEAAGRSRGEARRSGGARRGQVPEWALECENVRLCSLMFAYVRLCSLIRKKNVASTARGQRCARPLCGMPKI